MSARLPISHRILDAGRRRIRRWYSKEGGPPSDERRYRCAARREAHSREELRGHAASLSLGEQPLAQVPPEEDVLDAGDRIREECLEERSAPRRIEAVAMAPQLPHPLRAS